MAVNFPSTPSNGQLHTQGGRTWQYIASVGVWASTEELNSGIVDMTINANTQVLTLVRGDNVTVDIDFSSISRGSNTSTTSGTLQPNNTVVFTRADTSNYEVDLSGFAIANTSIKSVLYNGANGQLVITRDDDTTIDTTIIVNPANTSTSAASIAAGIATFTRADGSTFILDTSDIEGKVKSVNGTAPDSNGNIAVTITSVTTGNAANRPASSDEGDVYVISGDPVANTNGDSFIWSNTAAAWLEISPPDRAANDVRYVNASGDTMDGDLVVTDSAPSITIQDTDANGSSLLNFGDTVGGVFSRVGYIGKDDGNPDIKINADRGDLVLQATGDVKIGTDKIWTAGNDGTTSGLDADLLDGFEGTHYLDYTNFTNTPNDSFTSTSVLTGNTLLFTRNDSTNYSVDLAPIVSVAKSEAALAANNTHVANGALSGNTLNLNKTDGTVVAIDLSTLSTGANVATSNGVLTGNTVTFTRADSSTFDVDFSALSTGANVATSNAVLSGNTVTFTRADSSTFDVDLTSLSVGANVATSNGVLTGNTVTFTRADTSTFDVDFSALSTGANVATSSASIAANGLVTFTRADASTFEVNLAQFAANSEVQKYLEVANVAANTSSANGALSGNTLTITRQDSSTFDVDLSGLVAAGAAASNNIFTNTAVLSANTITFTRNDASSYSTDLGPLVQPYLETANSISGATLSGNVFTLEKSSGISADYISIDFGAIVQETPANTSTANVTLSANTLTFTRHLGDTFTVSLDSLVSPYLRVANIASNTSVASAARSGNTVTFTREDASTFDIDLSYFKQDDGANTSVASASIASNNTVTFTRDDSTTFVLDLVDLGRVKTVNGQDPDANGDVTVSIANVSTGNLASRPGSAGDGDVYVVSGDPVSNNNGDSFIYSTDDASWLTVSALGFTETDARYLQLNGGTLTGKVTLDGAPTADLHAASKKYVDDSSNITISPTAPSSPIAGDLWFEDTVTLELFIYNGSAWISATGAGSEFATAELTDVSSTAATNNQVLIYSAASSEYVPTDYIAHAAVSDTAPATENGRVWLNSNTGILYVYDGSAWVA